MSSLFDRKLELLQPDMTRPDLSADYLIESLRVKAQSEDKPLTEADLVVLGTNVLFLAEDGVLDSDYIRNLNNRAVYLIRKLIEELKEDGVGCIQARPGLRVPVTIELHYEVVFESNYPAFISGVMQNAFFGNPTMGETKPWKSPKGRLAPGY